MNEPDSRIEQRYRELARPEPPAAIDAAILAASRRALAKPPARRHWVTPVAAAAVIVLALGVTLRMQREEPDAQRIAPATERQVQPTPSAPAPVQPVSPEITAPTRSERPGVTKPPVVKRAVPAPNENIAAPQPPAADDRASSATVSPMMAPGLKREAAPAAAGAPASPAAPARPLIQLQRSSGDGLGAELEEIARLRAAGRDTEANAALEEFRRKHPDYSIPAEIWERVRPR